MNACMTFRRFFLFLLIISTLGLFFACNNPFSTRDAQKPDKIGGEAIKPANSPENVIYNLKTAFANMSIQDYLDVFSEDFMFNPDPDDSLLYVEDFRGGWGIEKEQMYAENFLQKRVNRELTFVTHTYEYKAGDDLFDYKYSILVFPAQDSTKVTESNDRFKVSGRAWLYLRDDGEGKWKIYKWVELENMKEGSFITWGVLRRSNI